MLFGLARNWSWILLRGVVGVLFGVVALLSPATAVAILVGLFGAYALVDGVCSLIAAWRHSDESSRRWALLFSGLVGTGIGLLTFFLPELTALTLVYWVGSWAVLTGVLEISAALALRRHLHGELWLGLSGLLSLLFGIGLFLRPGVGLLVLAVWMGVYALVSGGMLLALAVRLRGLTGSRRLTAAVG